jgi:hypothetical protein
MIPLKANTAVCRRFRELHLASAGGWLSLLAGFANRWRRLVEGAPALPLRELRSGIYGVGQHVFIPNRLDRLGRQHPRDLLNIVYDMPSARASATCPHR